MIIDSCLHVECSGIDNHRCAITCLPSSSSDHYSSGVVSFEPLQNQPPTLLSAVWRAELLTYGLKAQRSYARYGGATSEVKSAAAECKSVACLIWVDPVCNVGTKLLEVVWPKQTRVKNVPSALLYSNSTKYT